jgi:hypothetical protein
MSFICKFNMVVRTIIALFATVHIEKHANKVRLLTKYLMSRSAVINRSLRSSWTSIIPRCDSCLIHVSRLRMRILHLWNKLA